MIIHEAQLHNDSFVDEGNKNEVTYMNLNNLKLSRLIKEIHYPPNPWVNIVLLNTVR